MRFLRIGQFFVFQHPRPLIPDFRLFQFILLFFLLLGIFQNRRLNDFFPTFVRHIRKLPGKLLVSRVKRRLFSCTVCRVFARFVFCRLRFFFRPLDNRQADSFGHGCAMRMMHAAADRTGLSFLQLFRQNARDVVVILSAQIICPFLRFFSRFAAFFVFFPRFFKRFPGVFPLFKQPLPFFQILFFRVRFFQQVLKPGHFVLRVAQLSLLFLACIQLFFGFFFSFFSILLRNLSLIQLCFRLAAFPDTFLQLVQLFLLML